MGELMKSAARLSAVVLAGIALSPIGNSLALPDADAAKKSSAGTPRQMPVVPPSERKGCGGNIKVKLSLRESQTDKRTKTMKLIAKACPGVDKKELKNITLRVSGPPKTGERKAQVRSWRIKRFNTNYQGHRRNFRLNTAQSLSTVQHHNPSAARRQSQIRITAYNRQGRQVGDSRFNKRQKNQCQPHPDFQRGFQDDRALLNGTEGPIEGIFDIAQIVYPGSSILRLNLLYDDLINGRLQKYNEVIDKAKSRGYKIFLTLMPNPDYVANASDKLNYENYDPMEFGRFARTAMLLLGEKIDYLEIGNEPNHPVFMKNPDIKTYLLAVKESLKAIKQINQGLRERVKIVVGGLAPSHPDSLVNWLNALRGLGHYTSLHPYGYHINNLSQYSQAAGKDRLIISEHGNFSKDPNQLINNYRDYMKALCARLKIYLNYMIFNLIENNQSFDTGVIASQQNNPG